LKNTSSNKIYIGDCIEVMQELYRENGSFVDLVFADPPYNLEKSYKGYSDDLKDKEYIQWCEKWLFECTRLLKPTGSLFVLNLPKWSSKHVVFLNNYMYMQNWIVWDALSDPRGKLMPAHYSLLHYTKSNSEFTLNEIEAIEPTTRCLRPKCVKTRPDDLLKENLTNIWHDVHRIKHKKDRDAHPCQLPEKLLERVICLASNSGDIVFDPFMGTGTTAVVAKRLERNYCGVEKDETYAEISRQRLESFAIPRPPVPRKITKSKKEGEIVQLPLAM
jgi:DNA modification methylase